MPLDASFIAQLLVDGIICKFLDVILSIFRVFKGLFFKTTDLVRFVLFPKQLATNQKATLQAKSTFYNTLYSKEKRVFEHRCAKFIQKFDFVGRNITIDDTKKILIAESAIKLTFGLHQYLYKGFKRIIVYPNTYISGATQQEHKGETNPKLQLIVLSWSDFLEGNDIPNDNLNLGLHEFSHALQLSFKKYHRSYSAHNFNKYFKLILKDLEDKKQREKLLEANYLRAYAYENQYEFLAVMVEYFFESPQEFKLKLPKIYENIKRMLNVYY